MSSPDNIDESIYAIKDWISKTAKVRLTDNFIENLSNGVVLCLVINGLIPDKIEINLDGDSNGALENLENFLQAAKEMGVDEEHLFDVKALHMQEDPSPEVLKHVYQTLSALKFVSEEKGSLEEQNKWTKDAAESRAKQDQVAKTYAKKEDKQLDDVTAAVREFKNKANDVTDLRYKKEGQQKWGLFETNYQRQKGITVAESLAEIENYSKTGEAPKPMPKKGPVTVGGMAFRDQLEGNITKKEEERTGKKKMVKTGRREDGVFVCGSGTAVGMNMRKNNGKGELEVKPTAGGRAGDEFFKKFAKQEAKKYTPGNENNPNKLW